MTLSKQQKKVYDYIAAHRGCTTKDIQRDIGVSCPSGRITEMREKGVKITSIGQRKYEGSRAFECYAVEEPHKPKQVIVHLPNGSVRETFV